ncbi:hypothetical protein DKX38_014744 [Salix brachista]|uniref:GDSL esterase/lipase n=1 Tax=Salix brachista TaxID=2182728 RepID=A0A5N5LGH2_9ROSI|nr:hypothetical protein DKX38_014744 [Salix brachista]
MAKRLDIRTTSSRRRSAMVFLCLLLAILMSLSGRVHGQFLPTAPSVMENGSHVSALYLMGDSSVDCGKNSLFYPLLHRNLSLLPCNGGDSTLLPHLLERKKERSKFILVSIVSYSFSRIMRNTVELIKVINCCFLEYKWSCNSSNDSQFYVTAAQKIGLPNSQPFYRQIGSIEGLIKGVNYGSAHATIISPSSQSHPSFNQQLRQVYETFQLLQLQLRQDRAQDFIKSSMFYLSFGRDDYVDLFLRNSSGMMLKYSGQEFARILANQMVHAIRTLYDANVRKIIITGILPLGCTPRVVWEWYNSTATHDGMGCVEEINELVLQYNTLLNEHIVELNEELPDAQIIFCDVYQGMMEVITKPALFGFSDTKNACCGLGLHGAEIGCVSAETTCNQSSSHVWWDLYNPTQALNSLLADSAWFGHPLPDICRPITVQDLVSTSHLT